MSSEAHGTVVGAEDIKAAIASMRHQYDALAVTFKRRLAAAAAEERRDAAAERWHELCEQSEGVVARIAKARALLAERIRAAATEVSGCIAAEQSAVLAHRAAINASKRRLVALTEGVDRTAAAAFGYARHRLHRLHSVAQIAESHERAAMHAADVDSALTESLTAMLRQLDERVAALHSERDAWTVQREDERQGEVVRRCASGVPVYSISSAMTALELQRRGVGGEVYSPTVFG